MVVNKVEYHYSSRPPGTIGQPFYIPRQYVKYIISVIKSLPFSEMAFVVISRLHIIDGKAYGYANGSIGDKGIPAMFFLSLKGLSKCEV